MEQMIRIFCTWMNVLIRRIGNTPVDDYYYSHPVLTLVRVFAGSALQQEDGKKRPYNLKIVIFQLVHKEVFLLDEMVVK